MNPDTIKSIFSPRTLPISDLEGQIQMIGLDDCRTNPNFLTAISSHLTCHDTPTNYKQQNWSASASMQGQRQKTGAQ